MIVDSNQVDGYALSLFAEIYSRTVAADVWDGQDDPDYRIKVAQECQKWVKTALTTLFTATPTSASFSEP